MEFRIKWSQYRLNAATEADGVKKLADAIKRDPAFFFHLEQYTDDRPLWRKFLFG